MTAPTPIERALCCGPTCGRTRPEHGECVAAGYGRAQIERLEDAGYVVVPRGEVSDVIAWLLLALNAQQLQAATSDRLIALTARNQRREIGDIIADAQRFRASLPAATTGNAT